MKGVRVSLSEPIRNPDDFVVLNRLSLTSLYGCDKMKPLDKNTREQIINAYL